MRVAQPGFELEARALGDPDAAEISRVAVDLQPPRIQIPSGELGYAAHCLGDVPASPEPLASPVPDLELRDLPPDVV